MLQVRHLVQEQQAAAVLMAYGISAAGKTYTIEGTRSEPGVLPRALDLLFQVLPILHIGIGTPVYLCVVSSQVYAYTTMTLLTCLNTPSYSCTCTPVPAPGFLWPSLRTTQEEATAQHDADDKDPVKCDKGMKQSCTLSSRRTVLH